MLEKTLLDVPTICNDAMKDAAMYAHGCFTYNHLCMAVATHLQSKFHDTGFTLQVSQFGPSS